MITTLKENAWIAAIVLLFVAVFRDAAKAALTKGVNALGLLLYKRLAGSRLLRRRALHHYCRGLLEATGRIHVPFRPNRPLVLDDIYTPLLVAGGKSEQSVEAAEVLDAYKHLMVTGPPGAGKSVLLRRAAARGASPDRPSDRSRLPVLVELHRVADGDQEDDSIERQIVDAFARCGFPRADKFVRAALDRGWLQLLLDGFDEVQSSDRVRVAGMVRDFLERERGTAAVITCRTAVYRGEFDSVVDRHVELEPFEDQQIQAFLNSWKDAMPPGKSPAHLMAALREQPKLLKAARNPLLLTIIAHLYSDSPAYTLPRSRAEFYGQAAVILLDQWQGHLGRNQFDGPDKSTVLSALALKMQETAGQGDRDRRTIARQDALASATAVMPSLGMDASKVGPMMREIVERSGLLVSIDGGARYMFAHLTFQEYFAADALASWPDDLLERFERDPDAWREVVLLWCGLAADSTAMIEKVSHLDEEVALACVAEARAVEQEAADSILDPVIQSVRGGTASDEQQRSIGAVAADVRPRGDRVLGALLTGFGEAEDTTAMTCIAGALSASNRLEAAEAIVQRLDEEPKLMSAVIRLGELAVPGLEKDGLGGGSRLSCACLASIGTASAGVALARVMLKGGPLATPAAWGLTAVIESPLVVDGLRSLCERDPEFDLIPYGQEVLLWVSDPLVGFGPPGLTGLIGRAAYLVRETHNLEDAIAIPDPRISVALCALKPGPLDRRIGAGEERVHRLVDAANSVVQGVEFDFDRTERIVARDSELRLRNLDPAEWRPVTPHRTWSDVPTLRAFVELVASDLKSDERWEAMERRRGELPQKANQERRGLQEGFDEVLRLILETLDEPVWVHLVGTMPAQLRKDFFFRAGRGGMTPESWSSAYSELGFTFGRSQGFGFVLAIAFGLSLVAVAQGVAIAIGADGSNWIRRSLAVVATGSVIGTWIWMRVNSAQTSPSTWKIGYSRFWQSLFAFLLVPLLITEGIRAGSAVWKEMGISPTAPLFLPCGLWLSVEGLVALVGLPAAAGAVAAALLVATLLIRKGMAREESLRRPFAGVFSGRSLAVEEGAA